MIHQFKKTIKMKKTIIIVIVFTLSFLINNKVQAQQDPNFTL